jgi:hypothetical protein
MTYEERVYSWYMTPRAAAASSRLARGAALAVAVAVCLHAGPGTAGEDCVSQAGAQLLRQQMQPNTPAYYLACNLPAASRGHQQIAIADDGDILGPSSCQNQVCTFKAKDGRAVKRWELQTAPPGVTLDAHLAPLAEALRAHGYTPMTALHRSAAPAGAVLTLGELRIEFHNAPGSAWLVVHARGRAATRYRFAPRTMRCHPEPPRRTLPSDVRAWAQEGVPALVVAAQYPASELGCSWTEWVVVPITAGSKH